MQSGFGGPTSHTTLSQECVCECFYHPTVTVFDRGSDLRPPCNRAQAGQRALCGAIKMGISVLTSPTTDHSLSPHVIEIWPVPDDAAEPIQSNAR